MSSTELNETLLGFISSVSFHLFKVTPRKLRVTSKAHILACVAFLSDIAVLEIVALNFHIWLFLDSGVKSETGQVRHSHYS